MYLRSLSVKHLKRLRDFELSLTNDDGTPRMWTVLIGENGSGKTSVLQAIALAASGKLLVNDVAGSSFVHLRDRRTQSPLAINAVFTVSSQDAHKGKRTKDTNASAGQPPRLLHSEVTLRMKETSLRAKSWFESSEVGSTTRDELDPLQEARAGEKPGWFVIAYGVQRTLPESGRVSDLTRPSADRMKSLFDSSYPITSTAFLGHFGSRQAKARTYTSILKSAIIGTGILPEDVVNLELRGQGGVAKATDLLERDRFHQALGSNKTAVKVPAVALAHGYRSTIAWIADLVGHILLESDADVEPADFEGLVLIDEIDLYLHPKWQALLIPALRKTFPRLQFVVTTHSPVVMATLQPDEIIRLEADEQSGDVRRITPDAETGLWDPVDKPADLHTQPDPRTMTGTEVYRDYFGIDRLTLDVNGELIRRYTSLATNPARTPHQEATLRDLTRQLKSLNIQGLAAPVEAVQGTTPDDQA